MELIKTTIDDKLDGSANVTIRLNEFYTETEIDAFGKFCVEYNIPYKQAVNFLWGQTHADYSIHQRQPIMAYYMQLLLEYLDKDR
jgi:hypothetical protein